MKTEESKIYTAHSGIESPAFERSFCRNKTGRGAPRKNPRRKECERNEPIKSIKVGIGKIWGNVQGHHAGSRRRDQAKNRSEARLQPVWPVLEIALTEG